MINHAYDACQFDTPREEQSSRGELLHFSIFCPPAALPAVFRYPSRICRVRPSVFGIVYSFHPLRLDRSNIAKQKLCHGSNVICDGSPSRIRRVRRISFGITILPRSSTRRTIPVAFINLSLLALRLHCYCLQVLGNYAICSGIGNAVFCQTQ